MQEELKTFTKKTLSAEERAHQMDEVLSSEEAKLVQLEREVTLEREKQVWPCPHPVPDVVAIGYHFGLFLLCSLKKHKSSLN